MKDSKDEAQDGFIYVQKPKYETLRRKLSVDSEAALPKRMRLSIADFGKHHLHLRFNLDQVPFNLDNSLRDPLSVSMTRSCKYLDSKAQKSVLERCR